MSDKTGIEWTEATWNPILGCSKISAGCKNCYAIRTAWRLQHNPNPKVAAAFEGLTKIEGGKPNWTGRINFVEDRLNQPLRWKEPRRIFVNSQSDIFHESVTDQQIDQIFAVMASSGQHTFQVLTKRPDRMLQWFNRVSERGPIHANMYQSALIDFYSRHGVDLTYEHQVPERPTGELRFLYDSAFGIDPKQRIEDRDNSNKDFPECHWREWPLSNVWLGVSCEDQKAADERIPWLLKTPAAVRWVSAEPLLGPIDLSEFIGEDGTPERAAIGTEIDWIVAGGESGPDARPMHPDWARSLRDQCQAAGVPFFFKQWGNWASPDQFSSDGWDDVAMNANGVSIYPEGRITSEWGIASDDSERVWHVGKKAAGRLLDGKEHSEYPRQEA